MIAGKEKGLRHTRVLLWSLVLLIAVTLLLPLTGYVYVGMLTAQANPEQEGNPRANFWRTVREGNAGYTAVRGQESAVLIQNGGQSWRQLRNGPVMTYGTMVLGAVTGLLLIYLLLRGQVKLEGGYSGHSVERWSLMIRSLHWYTAILFIMLEY